MQIGLIFYRVFTRLLLMIHAWCDVDTDKTKANGILKVLSRQVSIVLSLDQTKVKRDHWYLKGVIKTANYSCSFQWKHVNTIGLSWKYNAKQQDKDYEIGKNLYDRLKAKQGRFLFNLGLFEGIFLMATQDSFYHCLIKKKSKQPMLYLA